MPASQPPPSQPPPSQPTRPNRQREHQANERTFLAWLRTSIALIGFGFALARFGLFLQQAQVASGVPDASAANSQTLGIGLVTLGVAVIVMAAWRHNRVFHQIETQAFRPSRWIIWLITSLVTLLGLLSLPLLMGQRSSNQSPRQSSRQTSLRRSLPVPYSHKKACKKTHEARSRSLQRRSPR